QEMEKGKMVYSYDHENEKWYSITKYGRDRDVLERIRSQYQGIPIVLIPSHDSSNIIGKERLLHLLREVKVIE
ncbi:MAG: hypothetical protein QW726_04590, partial [Fervidicoccaceae archaeon]